MTTESRASTGFPALDKMFGLTNGVFPGNAGSLICLAARPGMGKSTLASDIAFNVAMSTNKEVIYFSLEMTGKQIADRLVSKLSGVNLSDIREGKLNCEDKSKVSAAIQKLNSNTFNLTIYDQSDLSPDDIEKILKNREKPAFVIIDYLGLMRLSDKTERTRLEEIRAILYRLKEITKNFKVSIIYLSQLIKHVNKRPNLIDLRPYDISEQVSDIVSFLYREPFFTDSPRIKDADITELIIAKNSYGKLGTVNLHFDGNTLKFSE